MPGGLRLVVLLVTLTSLQLVVAGYRLPRAVDDDKLSPLEELLKKKTSVATQRPVAPAIEDEEGSADDDGVVETSRDGDEDNPDDDYYDDEKPQVVTTKKELPPLTTKRSTTVGTTPTTTRISTTTTTTAHKAEVYENLDENDKSQEEDPPVQPPVRPSTARHPEVLKANEPTTTQTRAPTPGEATPTKTYSPMLDEELARRNTMKSRGNLVALIVSCVACILVIVTIVVFLVVYKRDNTSPARKRRP